MLKKILSGIIFLSIIAMWANLTLSNENNPIKVQEHVMENGLKIIIFEDHSSPVIYCAMNYYVGSIYENEGKTGISHFLEHMMFKGTEIFGTKNFAIESALINEEEELIREIKENDKNGDAALAEKNKQRLETVRQELSDIIIPNDFANIWTRHGAADFNAFTHYYWTSYTCNLLSNKLEMWFLMEADRMKNLVLREFYAERNVVLEEMRLSDNNPARIIDKKLMEEVFGGTPYGRKNGIIGTAEDLKSIQRKDVTKYYQSYYSPNNAVVVISGDCDMKKAINFANKYLNSISPKNREKLDTNSFKIARREKENRISFSNKLGQNAVNIGYATTTAGHADGFTLACAAKILYGGKTSIFREKLLDKSLVSHIEVHSFSYPYARIFEIYFEPNEFSAISPAEEIIYSELEKLKNGLISQDQLAKAKKQMKTDFCRSIDTAEKIVYWLGYYEIAAGNWKNINKVLENIEKITAEDISRAAKKYFIPENRTVLIMNGCGNETEEK